MTTDDYVLKIWNELYPDAGDMTALQALSIIRAEIRQLREIEARVWFINKRCAEEEYEQSVQGK